jgi:uncharacterized membrane protein
LSLPATLHLISVFHLLVLLLYESSLLSSFIAATTAKSMVTTAKQFFIRAWASDYQLKESHP